MIAGSGSGSRRPKNIPRGSFGFGSATLAGTCTIYETRISDRLLYGTFSWPPQDKNRADARIKELAGSPSLISKKSASRKSPIMVPLSLLGSLEKTKEEGAGGSVLHKENGAKAMVYDRRRLPLLDRKLLLASGVLVQEYR
jgi:hypothetical protein